MNSSGQELQRGVESALNHHRQGRFTEAESGYRQLLTVAPDCFDALHLLGILYRQTGKTAAAIDLIARALAVNDRVPAAHNNLGVAYQASNRHEEALRCYGVAISLSPEYAEAYYNLATALSAVGRQLEAEHSYRKAIEFNPNYVEAYNNLGVTLRERDKQEEAVTAFENALRIRPSVEIYGNLGAAFRAMGEPEQAEAAYGQAVALDPDFMEAHHNLSHAQLIQGKYTEGFARNESRFEVGSGKRYKEGVLGRFRRFRRWEGESLAGRSLLVITEQGIGDNIMMMRYLPLLKQQNLEKLTLCYHHSLLKRLLQNMPGVDAVVSLVEGSALDEPDLYCPSMSLPHLFRTTIDTVPNGPPYLLLPAGMREPWRNRLAGMKGPKVGLVWAAGCYLNQCDELRSIPLSAFAPLVGIPGLNFVTLQKDEAALQKRELGWELLDWMDDCADFLDTAALVAELDLVISVDTAVVHLAGALGKPVWLLNRFAGDWRWLQKRDDSPWYPRVRIFRQQQRGDWSGVISTLADELRRL